MAGRARRFGVLCSRDVRKSEPQAMLEPQTRILVLGATGRTGALAVDYALSDQQLRVVALVRSPERIKQRPGLTIVPGTPATRADVARAVEGCFAVVSFLGAGVGPRLPWSRPAPSSGFLQQAIANTLEAMTSQGARRIVVLSAAGVGDSFAHAPRLGQLWIRSGLRDVYDQHEAQEQLLQSSGLDWTAVRAVALAGRRLRRTTLSYDGQPKAGLTISRKQVATFMIDCLGHPEFYGRAPVAS